MVIVGIWAPEPNGLYMKLVWKKTWTVEKRFYIEDLQTPVKVYSGYLIGLQYPLAGARGADTGVIPYFDSRDDLIGTGVEAVELSGIYTENVTDSDLPLGTRKPMTAYTGVKRLPALKVLTNLSGNVKETHIYHIPSQ